MKPVTIIVETTKGSTQKYDYDPELKSFKLNKILPAGMLFPFDFGFIPGTKGEDGDPLDIIVVAEFSTFPGCMIDCRIIGAIKASQTEKDQTTVRNDRFIGIPVESLMFKNIDSLAALPAGYLDEIEAFFKNYNAAAGKEFVVLDRLDATEAAALVKSN